MFNYYISSFQTYIHERRNQKNIMLNIIWLQDRRGRKRREGERHGEGEGKNIILVYVYFLFFRLN